MQMVLIFFSWRNPFPNDLKIVIEKLDRSVSTQVVFENIDLIIYTMVLTVLSVGFLFIVDTGENLGKSSSKEGRSKSSSSTSTSQTESFLSTSSQMEPPSLDAKTKFGSNLFRLTGVQLGHVLQVIDLKCPRALERPLTPNDPSNAPSSSLPPPNGENVEINVDAIDMKTFYELDHYVKERISKNRRKSSGEKEDSLSRSTSGSVLDNLSQSSTFTSNQYFRSNQSGSSGSGSSKKVGKRKR